MKKGIHSIYLSTGSNLGPSIEILEMANCLIQKHIGNIKLKSAFYKTAAWGNTNQPDFINQVLNVHTLFTPLIILKKIEKIERELGRLRVEKWGPRIIDIDILLYDNEIIKTAELEIPHPEMLNRNFVLKPLLEIASKLIMPNSKQPLKELAKKNTDILPILRLP